MSKGEPMLVHIASEQSSGNKGEPGSDKFDKIKNKNTGRITSLIFKKLMISLRGGRAT